MIYLVSEQAKLFDSPNYEIISKEQAYKMLEPLDIISADTETEGLDPYTKKLLTVQLGNNDFQIVIDCTTIDITFFKDLFESDRTFMFWNAAFDLLFLYHKNIYPNNIYDGFIVEKLLWLGYSYKEHGFSLKDAGYNYLNIELDKSVRGKIITVGLTDEVIVYGANDIKYQLQIKEKQEAKLVEQELEYAAKFENEFVKCLAYIKYCGVKLDVEKWKEKAKQDISKKKEYEEQLNQYVIKWCEDHAEQVTTTYYPVDISELWNEYMINDYVSHNLPKGVIRCPLKDKDSFRVYVLKKPNPYVHIETQGDLFNGFNLSPKCTINWASTKQVVPFFELLGIHTKGIDPATKKYKTSIDEKVLAPQKNDFEIIPIFLKYKEVAKLSSTYGLDFLKNVNSVSGRIHSDFFQLGTNSGRLSSQNPNMQNLPRDTFTRSCFIPEKGNAWISADYSG